VSDKKKENIFVIISTQKTPEIRFYPDEFYMKISGRCIPENPVDFFSKIQTKLEEFIASIDNKDVFTIDVDLEYINSISTKYLYLIFMTIKDNFKKTILNWYYEDVDDKELGEDFELLMQMKFNFIKKK